MPEKNTSVVTPEELHARQVGLCWLELTIETDEEGERYAEELFCTDGKDYYETDTMLNPTVECIFCMRHFNLGIANAAIKRESFQDAKTIIGSQKGRTIDFQENKL